MGGGIGRRGLVRVVVVAAALTLAVACGAPAPEPTAVPTFPAVTAAPGGAAAPGGDGRVVPQDCTRILAPDDLGALLGLPLNSVTVRTTIGVAQPAVGRTERVSCRYSGTAGSPDGGRTLLDLNVTAYVDQRAAAAQWRINVETEEGDRREMSIGSASAALFERGGEAVLMVLNGTGNLTIVLPDRPLPAGRTGAATLVDLALRVLPTATVPMSAPASNAPSQVSGAVS